MIEFREWPKIPRGQNEKITITEKIDGTNACVIVEETHDDGEFVVVGAQSRNQLLAHNHFGELKVYNDNYEFAKWVVNHKDELSKLGVGYHYGEWAGPGIQKNPHNLLKRQFMLFNTNKWLGNSDLPSCCSVVPLLYEGEYHYGVIEEIMDNLLFESKEKGYTPEGVVVWFHKTRRYEKWTFKNQNGKWSEVS